MAHWLKYVIYWQDIMIGKIYQKDDKFRYYPNYDNIDEAEKYGLWTQSVKMNVEI